ncbi:hypothetical protein BDZ89DRAFT_1050610 [Hymenopellis radicata]|nr:hypothetical protein BDZ89DRAFT_1050610 [Hymenopellis radicata]
MVVNHDTFCSLTGGCYYKYGDDVVLDFVKAACDKLPQNDPLRPSDSILERLEYTADDVEGSQDLVLLVSKKEDGELDIKQYDGPTPTVFSDSTVAAVVNFTIGDCPDLSEFKVVFPDDPAAEDLHVSMFYGYNKFYIFLYAYRILIGRFPELEPYMIYAVLASPWGWGIDEEYSIIADQYAFWWLVADVDEGGMEDPEVNGYDNLGSCYVPKARARTTLYATPGSGRESYITLRAQTFFLNQNPWYRFQLESLFSKLPFDVLDYLCVTYLSIREASSLLCLNRSLRAALLPFVNFFAQNAIARRHPYWLPIVAPCLRGDEEQLRWERMWEGLGGEVPWAPYARECAKSPGMRNRQRIWGMAERFRNQVKEKGWLDGRTSI